MPRREWREAKESSLEDYQKDPQRVNRNVPGKEGENPAAETMGFRRTLGEGLTLGTCRCDGRKRYKVSREKELLNVHDLQEPVFWE